MSENPPKITFGNHSALFCNKMICGAAIPPSRPPAEQNPKPVARIQVGYSSHVKLKTTANEPDIAILPTKAFYQISSVFIGQFFKGSHR